MNVTNMIDLETQEKFSELSRFSLYAKNPGISYLEWFLAIMVLPY